MISRDFFIRNLEANSYRENFLVSAIVTVFVIRIFLKLTDYPQLGGGDLHIAHVLWGGLFMVAAIIILLSALNKAAVSVASILGGIGFGTFIDELGKLITKDNDYFFQPTIAFIYITFVLIYLVLRAIPRYEPISEKEYLANTVELLKESAINDFDHEEEKRALRYLKRCDPKDPIVISLTQLLSRIETLPVKPSFITRIRAILRRWYNRVAHSSWILKGVMFFLAFQILRVMFEAGMLMIERPDLVSHEWGKLLSSLLAAIFLIVGFSALRFSKVEAYKFFRIALLISLFLVDFFAFMTSQWYELISVFANVFVLLVINYAQGLEREKRK
jgi:hypothetical protein